MHDNDGCVPPLFSDGGTLEDDMSLTSKDNQTTNLQADGFALEGMRIDVYRIAFLCLVPKRDRCRGDLHIRLIPAEASGLNCRCCVRHQPRLPS